MEDWFGRNLSMIGRRLASPIGKHRAHMQPKSNLVNVSKCCPQHANTAVSWVVLQQVPKH